MRFNLITAFDHMLIGDDVTLCADEEAGARCCRYGFFWRRWCRRLTGVFRLFLLILFGVAVAKLDLKEVMKKWGVVPENTNFGIKSSVLESFLQGNDVDYDIGSDKTIPKRKLAKKITNNTLYLSCWMTMAQIEQMRSKKVIFENLD